MDIKPVQWDDETLVRGCQNGKKDAQRALYERYNARMFGLCYRYAQSRFDAEDILQEGFIKVYTHLDQYKFSGSLEGWIKRIMVTTAINFLKSRKHFTQNLDLDNAEEVMVFPVPEQSLHHQEVIRLMGSLSPGYRAILNLYAVEGYSHKEIGHMLGIAESTSRSQYARAKNIMVTLLESLEQQGVPIQTRIP